jgi:hypothetical protein
VGKEVSSTQKVILGKKNDEMMSALPYQKKREKIYKEKKERKKGEKEHSAILDLCYH